LSLFLDRVSLQLISKDASNVTHILESIEWINFFSVPHTDFQFEVSCVGLLLQRRRFLLRIGLDRLAF